MAGTFTREVKAALKRLDALFQEDGTGNVFARDAATTIRSAIWNHFGRGELSEAEQSDLLRKVRDDLDAALRALAPKES